jgi:hypothetical protein
VEDPDARPQPALLLRLQHRAATMPVVTWAGPNGHMPWRSAPDTAAAPHAVDPTKGRLDPPLGHRNWCSALPQTLVVARNLDAASRSEAAPSLEKPHHSHPRGTRRCRGGSTGGDVEEARSTGSTGVEVVAGSWDGEMSEMREKT